jgi:uncharacterized protein YidB (DUF937 family)
MSEFLGQIAGSTASLMSALPGLLSQLLGTAEGATGGGLPVLLAQFENAGLGSKVRSWLGPEANEPITAEQVASAIPLDTRQAWAKQAGISVEQLDQVLANVLPSLIDHATPNGVIPADEASLPEAETLMTRLFGR